MLRTKRGENGDFQKEKSYAKGTIIRAAGLLNG